MYTSKQKFLISNTTPSHQINFIPNHSLSVFSKQKQNKNKKPLPRELVYSITQACPSAFSNSTVPSTILCVSVCVSYAVLSLSHPGTLALNPHSHTHTQTHTQEINIGRSEVKLWIYEVKSTCFQSKSWVTLSNLVNLSEPHFSLRRQ